MGATISLNLNGLTGTDLYLRVRRPTILKQIVPVPPAEEGGEETTEEVYGIEFWTQIFPSKEDADANTNEIPATAWMHQVTAYDFDPAGDAFAAAFAYVEQLPEITAYERLD